MTANKEQIADVLRHAIKGEVDGYTFYDLLSKKATNPEAKKKLQTLRDDEERHKETLYKLYDEFIGGEVGELPPKGINALAEVFRRGRLEERKTEMEFLNLAIEAELAATRYYEEQRTVIDDPKFRKLFDELAAEEHSHFEILQAEKDALGGNYSWFGYDSSQPLEH